MDPTGYSVKFVDSAWMWIWPDKKFIDPVQPYTEVQEVKRVR